MNGSNKDVVQLLEAVLDELRKMNGLLERLMADQPVGEQTGVDKLLGGAKRYRT